MDKELFKQQMIAVCNSKIINIAELCRRSGIEYYTFKNWLTGRTKKNGALYYVGEEKLTKMKEELAKVAKEIL